MKVFISYTHDGREYAEKLEKDLKAQDIGIWIDKRCIRPGHIWLREIDEALAQADYVLGVITENYLLSVGGDEAYAIISKGLRDNKVRFISLFFTLQSNIKSVIIPALQGFHFAKDYTTGLQSTIDFLKQEQAGVQESTIKETVAPRETITSSLLHNLPAQSTPFVGRKEELTAIAERLSDPSCRLLTLLGPGGIGKTRLALQSASEKIGKFAHGVYFVPLAQLSSADFLVTTLADFLGFSFSGSDEPKNQLLNYLRTKAMLILMDNFEHLLNCAGLLSEILSVAPNVRIVVTSRERLNLMGEWTYEVPGLRFPETEAVGSIEEYGAVQLFLQNAKRISSGFSLSEKEKPFVSQICRLTGGMPLAIELASSWVKMLSCREIFQEINQNLNFLATPLRDVPGRHQSLRAVCEQSWKSLSNIEKDVFAKLSVFRGGFQRDAAEKITGASVLELAGLVDKSLLRWNPLGRYEMHELLRQYAKEKLNEVSKETEEIRDLHCDYYAEFLHQKKKYFKGASQIETLDEISEELENVREAWGFAVEKEKFAQIKKSNFVLYHYYDMRGGPQEGIGIFAMAAQRLEETDSTTDQSREAKDEIRAEMLMNQAILLNRLGFFSKARELLQKGLLVFHQGSDRKKTGYCLYNMAVAIANQGEHAEAKHLNQESLAIFEEIHCQDGIGYCLQSLGCLALRAGEYAEAKQLFERSYEIAQVSGDRKREATYLNNLANVSCALGEYKETEQLLQRTLIIARELGDRPLITLAVNNLGEVALLLGDYDKAQQLFKENLMNSQKIGSRRFTAVSLGNQGAVSCLLGNYAEAKQLLQESITIFNEMGYRGGMAISFIRLGNVANAQGEYYESVKYYKEVLKITKEIMEIPRALEAFLGIASVLTKQGKKDQALELLAFVIHHHSLERELKSKAELLFSEIAAQRPPHVVAMVQERGRTRKLEEIVEELLEEKE